MTGWQEVIRMQEENKIINEPETADMQVQKNNQQEPVSNADKAEGFAGEALVADHTDYGTDWSKYDIPDDEDKPEKSEGRVVKDSEYYDREIKKLKKKQEQHNNHYVRMRNKVKNELRKDRNARLVMWGAEFEYQIGQRRPMLKKLLPYLDRDLQKKIMFHIFAEIRTGPLIIEIIKGYTKDIKDILPDDLKPYAE